MDDADLPQPRIEMTVQIAREQIKRAPALRHTGCCHFCDEPVESPLLFCEKACAEDFEVMDAALKRAGRRSF